MTGRRTNLLVLLLLVALAGIVITGYWGKTSTPTNSTKGAPGESARIDTQLMATAQRLALLAVTPEERDFAQAASRLADHELDLAFASALRAATLHPAPPSPEARVILDRIEKTQGQVKPQQDDIAHIKQQLATAEGNQKQALEEELQLQEALLNVAQEELDAAQQELIRAGGDPKTNIQRLMEQHAVSHQRQTSGVAGAAVADGAQATREQPEERDGVSQFRAWRQWLAKETEVTAAQQEVRVRSGELTQRHKEVEAGQEPDSADVADQTTFSILRHAAEQQQNLAELDKRASDLQQMDALYGSWRSLIQARQREYALALVRTALWVFALVIVVFLADPISRFVFSRRDSQNKRLRTMRSVARFAIQAAAVGLMLLVILGPPGQLATVVALAGAGLTVALKDFIVGFVGWFALMGRDGIRPGDWVEIEGIGGEVLEVGLLHTVLLETGSWSEAGHPTGRQVTFVNSFAIEGHYFNFSTSGQWLWDEIQIPVPAGADPYPIVEAVQKVMLDVTQENARLAEQEWQRVVANDQGRSFSAAPTISLRPTSAGVDMIVRYITRAPERHEVRTKLYHQIVEILRSRQIPPPAAPAAPSPQLAQG